MSCEDKRLRRANEGKVCDIEFVTFVWKGNEKEMTKI